MPDNSFDIASKIDLQEVSNAIQQALKEVHTRFDLKDSKSNIELEKDAIVLHSADEYKLKAVNDVFQQKLVKRGVSLKGLTYGALEPAAGGTARRKGGQGFEEKGAGFDPGRFGADQQQGPRHAAGSHRHAAAA
jgi:cyclic-di-GMP-binding protein